MHKRRGFTLIELLVVIAIIALLMSILMPALARVRKQAQAAICMSNLKQWGTIFAMYTDTHDGYFMGGFHQNPDCPDCPREHWPEALQSYYGEPGGLTCCPTAAKEPDGTGVSGTTFEPWGLIPWRFSGEVGDIYGSYGTNTCIFNIPTVPGQNPSTDHWRRPDVKGAAIVPVLLDALWTTSYPWWSNDPPDYEGQRWRECGGMGVFCINRHNGVVNGLFMDWSVRKIGLKQLWRLKWCRMYDINAVDTYPVNWDYGTGWMAKFRDYDSPYE